MVLCFRFDAAMKDDFLEI